MTHDEFAIATLFLCIGFASGYVVASLRTAKTVNRLLHDLADLQWSTQHPDSNEEQEPTTTLNSTFDSTGIKAATLNGVEVLLWDKDKTTFPVGGMWRIIGRVDTVTGKDLLQYGIDWRDYDALLMKFNYEKVRKHLLLIKTTNLYGNNTHKD